jgi:capsular polysaccharide export protein
MLGWGCRESGRRAHEWAKRAGAATMRLEDGFLRSVALGVEGGRALSTVVDDVGIYYDAARPSRLEALVREVVAESDERAESIHGARKDALRPAQLAEAERAMALIVHHRLSKYNHAPDFVPPAGWRGDEVLVIDQTYGDPAVRLSGAGEDTFQSMLRAALDEHPQTTVWVKTHPDVLCGKKRGYLTDAVAADPRVRLLPLDINPISLLSLCGMVYVVSSQMGFEALLCGKRVVTFGLPWYSGWGLTDDRHPHAHDLAQRRGRASLTQLFDAAYLRYCRYMDPATGLRGNIFDVIGHLAHERRSNGHMRGELVCVGLSLWKRSVVTPFLRQGTATLRFVAAPADLRRLPAVPLRQVVLWGAGRDDVKAVAQELGLPTLRMEDGFIRSVGLGSNLVPPLSLVVDDMGIYFDPRTPSRLEAILVQADFEPGELEEAAALRKALVSARIGKYNVGRGGVPLPVPRPAKVILVPGQVEDDASIRTGSRWLSTNFDLLAAVRAAHPDAFIIFKPHPDVVSGNRAGAVPQAEAARVADLVADEADVIACIDQVDEVHTMTSLTGFEALLRGKRVVCYGAPFYAGWGLTHDVFAQRDGPHYAGRMHAPEQVWQRRSRRLTLDELIAGTLVRYPRYVHPVTRLPTSALRAVAFLQQQRRHSRGSRLKRHWLAQQSGKLKMFVQAVSFEWWVFLRQSTFELAQRWLA